MTYSDNRGPSRHSSSNATPWIIGAIAVLAILGMIFYSMSDSGNQTASAPSAAATGAGPTAGQGANQLATPPAQPSPANR